MFVASVQNRFHILIVKFFFVVTWAAVDTHNAHYCGYKSNAHVPQFTTKSENCLTRECVIVVCKSPKNWNV